MTESIRQQIMTAFENRLSGIATPDGYQTDLGQHVFEWLAAPLQDSDLPAVIYRDMQDTVALTYGKEEHKLTVELSIFANATPDEMRKFIADIHVCLASPDTRLNGLAEDILPLSDETIEIEQDDKKYFGIKLKAVIQYLTNIWDPYNQ